MLAALPKFNFYLNIEDQITGKIRAFGLLILRFSLRNESVFSEVLTWAVEVVGA